MAKIGISVTGLIQVDRALHAYACERGGMLIPPGQFGGKASIGHTYPGANGGRGREYTAELYEESKCELFENGKLFQYARQPVPGAVNMVQMLKANGHDVVPVVNFRATSEPYVLSWWRQNNFPKDIRLEFVRNSGRTVLSHLEECDVVVDTKVSHLYQLRGRKGVLLVFLLPEPGGIGCDVIKPAPARKIEIVRGWPQARPVIMGHLAAAAIAA
ncbi:MAG TPA: hypothetical protein VEA92_00210 [Candidatus Paceibacterota bacterium]|nr:hypothetical protein [Candidatus Paceibacterota bacterium]